MKGLKFFRDVIAICWFQNEEGNLFILFSVNL